MRGMPGRLEGEVALGGLAGMFSDEGSARARFEARVWPEGRLCPRCGSGRTGVASHRTMPYWCTGCRSYFSVRTGTVMEASNLRFGCGCWRSIWIFLPGMASGCWSCAGLLGSLWMPPGSCRRGSARRAGSPVEADEIAAGESEGGTEAAWEPQEQKREPEWAGLLPPPAPEGAEPETAVYSDGQSVYQLSEETVERLQRRAAEIAARGEPPGPGYRRADGGGDVPDGRDTAPVHGPGRLAASSKNAAACG